MANRICLCRAQTLTLKIQNALEEGSPPQTLHVQGTIPAFSTPKKLLPSPFQDDRYVEKGGGGKTFAQSPNVSPAL